MQLSSSPEPDRPAFDSPTPPFPDRALARRMGWIMVLVAHPTAAGRSGSRRTTSAKPNPIRSGASCTLPPPHLAWAGVWAWTRYRSRGRSRSFPRCLSRIPHRSAFWRINPKSADIAYRDLLRRFFFNDVPTSVTGVAMRLLTCENPGGAERLCGVADRTTLGFPSQELDPHDQ
jgi:hypothetical protein